MALEELREAVLASRYLLGGSVVNDAAARSWFSQVDFDGSGAHSVVLFVLMLDSRRAVSDPSHRMRAGKLTRRAFRETLPEIGLVELGFHLDPSRLDGLVEAMAPDGTEVVRWQDFLIRSGLDVTSTAAKAWAQAQARNCVAKSRSNSGAKPESRSVASQPYRKQRGQLYVPDRAAQDALFDAFDVNANGKLSLAEIDKAIVEAFPAFDHKPALLLAYKAAEPAVYGEASITRSSFARLLQYIVYFNNLWHQFEVIDADGDRRITEDEWVRGCAIVGLKVSAAEARSAFQKMCVDNHAHNGYVLFGWFCEWCARTHHAQARPQEAEPEPQPQPQPQLEVETEPEAEPETEPETDPEQESEPVVTGLTLAEQESQRLRPRAPRTKGCGRQIDSVELIQELVLHALLEQGAREDGTEVSPDMIEREIVEETPTARLAMTLGEEAWDSWVSTSSQKEPTGHTVPVIWFVEWMLGLNERHVVALVTTAANAAAAFAESAVQVTAAERQLFEAEEALAALAAGSLEASGEGIDHTQHSALVAAVATERAKLADIHEMHAIALKDRELADAAVTKAEVSTALSDHTITSLHRILVVLRRASGDLDVPTPVDRSAGGVGTDDLHPIGAVAAMRRGYTPLILAAGRGNNLQVRLLLHSGAAVNIRFGAQVLASSKKGRLRDGTAVIVAAEAGHWSTVQWLLEEGGAQTHFRDQQGRTALAVAATRGDVEVTRQLLRNNANVGLTDERGRTALMCAVDTGHLGVAALLLQHEVQSLWFKRGRHVHFAVTVNSADVVGFTPLMSAASQGRADIIKLLLAHSADVDAQITCCCHASKKGQCRCRVGATALALAAEAQRGEAAAMLLEHEASDPGKTGAACASVWKCNAAASKAASSLPPTSGVTYTKWLQKRPPLVIPERDARMVLFDRIDVNRNNQLSLAEIDRYIVETFPDYNHKPALLRAYRAADKDDSSRIERKEFSMLLRLLVYFNHLWCVLLAEAAHASHVCVCVCVCVSITDIAAAPCGFHCMNRDIFDSIDRDSDHRLRRGEFAEGCKAVGMQLTALEIENEFKAADKNGGGFVLFEEFTLWCAQRQVIQDDWEAQEEAAVAEAA